MEETKITNTSKLPVVLPATDIFETEKELMILMEMPGVKLENVEIQLENDTLSIHGTSSLELPEGVRRSHAEFRPRNFKRVFEIYQNINSDAIEASLKDGVLKITLPKQAQTSKRISIKQSN